MTQLLCTFNFFNILGFQSKASSSIYPPWPGWPASPGGLEIFTSSELMEESDLDESEKSEPGGASEGVESQVEQLGLLNVTWV